MEKRPYNPVAIDTDETRSKIYGFIDQQTGQLKENLIKTGEYLTIRHGESVLYTSEIDIRTALPKIIAIFYKKPITSFFVNKVQGKYEGGSVLSNAKVTISLTKHRFSPRFQLKRDNFWFVVYPQDQVRQIK